MALWSRALFASAHFTRRMLASPPTHASSFGARWQPQYIVSRSSTLHPAPPRGGLQHLVPLFPDRSFTTGRCTSLAFCAGDPAVSFVGVAEPSQSPNPSLWCRSGHHSLNTNSSMPRHCPLRFQLLSTRSSLLPPACIRPHVVFLSYRHSPGHSVSNLSPPSLFAQRDWSTVVASCHHSLTEWHQSVLVHDSHSLPDFPERASILDTLFSSLTQILLDSASLHSRRRPTVSRPRRRQPLWWNDACYHALVARNDSWRDFRRSESQEDQARFRFMRQQFHSTVRASRTHFWNEWLGSVSHPSHFPVPYSHT